MLTVDPLKRISIQEIRKHPWFAKDLPDYLSPLAYLNQVSSYATLNDQVVLELSKKMKFSVATIHHALGERENNQIQVAYRLVVDQLPVGIKVLIVDKSRSTTDTVRAELKDVHISEIDVVPSSIKIITNSVPAAIKEEEPKKTRATRSRWHYGIRSRSDPQEIMYEIYNALGRTNLVTNIVYNIEMEINRCL